MRNNFIFIITACCISIVLAREPELNTGEINKNELLYEEKTSLKASNSFSRFYVLPEFVVNKGFYPLVGIGYRYHKNLHGADLSLHLLPISVCGQSGIIPALLKGSYLIYPWSSKDNFLYFGLGVTSVFPFNRIPYPTGTIGFELVQRKHFCLFFQYDTISFKEEILSLGIGF